MLCVSFAGEKDFTIDEKHCESPCVFTTVLLLVSILPENFSQLSSHSRSLFLNCF